VEVSSIILEHQELDFNYFMKQSSMFNLANKNKYSDELTLSTKSFVWLHHLVWEDEHKIKFSSEFAACLPFRSTYNRVRKKNLEIHSWYGRPFDSKKVGPTCFVSAQISEDLFKRCDLVIQSNNMEEILPHLEVLISGVFLKYKIDFIRILNASSFSDQMNFWNFEKSEILFPENIGSLKRRKILEIESFSWWRRAESQEQRLQLSYLTKRDEVPSPKKEKSRLLIRLFSLNRRQ